MKNKILYEDEKILKFEIKSRNESFECTIDRKNYYKINHYHWYLHRVGNGMYARADIKPRGKHVYLHELIIKKSDKRSHIDHININGLDNVESNLRECSHMENQWNKQIRKKNKSGYIGVCRNKEKTKWRSNIHYNGKQIFLGEFSNIIEAALKYDEACLKYRGAFARTNRMAGLI